jgi:hypothetical protein
MGRFHDVYARRKRPGKRDEIVGRGRLCASIALIWPMRGGRALVTIPKFESLIFPPGDPFKYGLPNYLQKISSMNKRQPK